jgi:hypothetical protein
LLVPTEFELTLTRLGDDPQSKWCLLNIRILVDSPEIGQGQHLVHPLQVYFSSIKKLIRLSNDVGEFFTSNGPETHGKQ